MILGRRNYFSFLYTWSSEEYNACNSLGFIGVEGAVVLSGRAKNSRDVGKATVLGLILVMSIYILISVLSMGAMTRGELSVLETPSMGHVLEHVVGTWGAVAINIGLVASLVGTLIGWFYLFLKFPM